MDVLSDEDRERERESKPGPSGSKVVHTSELPTGSSLRHRVSDLIDLAWAQTLVS